MYRPFRACIFFPEKGQHKYIDFACDFAPRGLWDVSLEELVGYYSNYRKVISPDLRHLLPTSKFKLYAICTRYPVKLLKDMQFTTVKPGIIDLTWGNRIIRIIVLKNITMETQNALWQLFSSQEKGFIFGNENYKWHYPEEQAILNQLYALYKIHPYHL